MNEAPPDEDFDKLPVEDRLAHKSWKARLSAYTELISTFKDASDATFRPYISNPELLKGFVRDSNAVAQEKGVEAAISFLEGGGKQAAKTRSEVVPSVVEKCLGSARAGTRTKAIELCLLYVECEEDQGEGVVTDVSPGLDVKQPKVVAGSVSVLKEMVRLFGPKTVSLKPILRLLPKIFAHADKTVRLEGTGLALALHAYLGPALDSHLTELKPVQVKELGEAFAAADGKGEGFGAVKQSRFTRSQQRERDVKEAEGALEGTNGEDAAEEEAEDAPPDAFDLAEPVDVLSKLPEDFYTHLSSSKWKDRKELALEPLLSLIKVPRLQPGNYTELATALAARMTDANVVCVALAANCLEALALGLRLEFAKYKGSVVAPILARTKEKKASVLDALGAALDAVFQSTTIADITEDVVTSSKDKNPSVKAETIKWCTRSLSTTTSPPPKADLDPLFDSFKKALEDSNEPVRAAAADALGTLMKVVGEKVLGGKVDSLDDLRKQKVKEAFEKAEVKCKNGVGAGTRSAPPAAVAAAPPAAKPKPRPPVANKENAAPPAEKPSSPPPPPPPPAAAPKGPPARLLAKKPPVASTSAPPAAAAAPKPKPIPAAASSAPKAASKPSEPLKYKMSQEDAEAQVERGALPEAIVAQLSEANWKQRLEGITALHDWLSGGEMNGVESELVVRWLSKKPGWKESNFQVGAKMFGIFQLLAERSPSFGKSSAALSIPALSEKLGDIKLKKPAGDALSTYAEKTSLQFVLGLAYEPMAKLKAPKAQADAMVWVDQVIREFGIVGLSIRDLIEYLKVGLKSSNAAVRTNATKTLVTLRLYVGADIVSFLQDLNPQLLTTIESEFAKVSGESPPEPTRVGADTVVAAAPAAGGGKGGKGKAAATEDDALDELFPRVELDKLIPSAAITASGDANWKIRKEALETIQSILEANKRLKPSNLSDLSTPLKQRLADSNKIVQQLALDIVSRIATGMGKGFDKHSRTFAAPTAQVLSESKAPIRAAAIVTLSAMADAAGLDTMIISFEKPLDSANPLLRKELLAWLEARCVDEEVVATLDLAPIAGSVLACLEDRTAEVRKSATAILPAIVTRAGYNLVMDLTSKLKPASRSTVIPLIEAARSSALTSAPTPAAAKAAAPAQTSAPSSRPASVASKPAAAAKPLGASRPATGVSKTLRTVASSASLPPLDDPPARASSALRKPPALGSKSLASASTSSRASPVPSAASPSSGKEAPFTNADPKPKTVRAAKETGSLKWVIEGTPRQDQVDALLQQMTPNTAPDVLAQLFSKDHNAERDFAAALTTLDECAKDEGAAAAMYDLSPEEMRARLVVNVDVMFKYITLRLSLTSTTITVKCLDLVDHLIPVLDAEGYKLSDYETSALLISLIAKVGDPKETIRNRVRAIFKEICRVYPFSKVFTAILEHGLVSKNARIRAESAEELGRLFTQHGPNAFPVAKALPLIAKLISDRDATVRTAALHAVGAVYSHLGADQTWKLVGQIPDKEKSMLEERLKRTAGGSGPSSGVPSAVASPARSSTPVGRVGTPSRLSAGSASGSPANGIPRGIPARAGAGISRLARPQSVIPAHVAPPSTDNAFSPRKPTLSGLQQPRQLARPSSTSTSSSRIPSNPSAASSRTVVDDYDLASTSEPIDNASLIDSLDTQDLAKCADALKQVQVVIASSPESLVSYADDLIESITAKMALGFSDLGRSTPQVKLRLCKHLMQALSTFFDHRTLGQAVSTPVLTDLLAELTGRLLDTAENPETEAISSLSKVLNMVLIRIFHHADANACFSALFSVLHDATHDLRELRGQELADRAKYAELVMKCLWKVSKTVKESLESRSLAASHLLRDINIFLERIPPAQWRRRATDNIPLADMPLRTVKTILQQVVSVYGDSVFDELDEIESAESSFVYQYLVRLGNTATATARRGSADSQASIALARQSSAGSLASVRRETAPSRMSATSPTLTSTPVERQPSSSSAGSARAEVMAAAVASPGGADVEMNHRLKEIFDLIGDPTHSREGIAELYAYQKLHPEAQSRIDTWMSGTGGYFQSYMRRALANLASADDAPSSRPFGDLPSAGEERSAATASPSTRPISSSSSTPTRPASGAPGSPRASSSRMSFGGGAPSTPGNSDRLSQLQGLFGYGDKPAPTA